MLDDLVNIYHLQPLTILFWVVFEITFQKQNLILLPLNPVVFLNNQRIRKHFFYHSFLGISHQTNVSYPQLQSHFW